MSGFLEVIEPGPFATLQDLGRPGWAHLGVGAAGAADRSAHALANRLVGNQPAAATIEALLGGLAFTVSRAVVVAVTGADAPIRVNDHPVGLYAPLHLAAGDVVRIGLSTAGLRSYVAVAGGLAEPPVLGSRSWDSLAALGPEPLATGRTLTIGDDPHGPPLVDAAPVTRPTLDDLVIGVLVGPRTDWLAGGLEALVHGTWRVSTRSDRVGIRLEGAPVARASDFEGRELPSEGVVRGAVQLPAGGQPVVFGADHPVTGGYPVVAIVTDADADRLAQARPGQAVRFRALRQPDVGGR